jgi:hypothetical protein
MGLPPRQRKALDGIEGRLRISDPRLVAMFFIFGRLTRDEDMPRIEELRHRAAMTWLRIRFWLAAAGRRLTFRRRGDRDTAGARGRAGRRAAPGSRAGRWRPMAVFFPLALVLMSASIFVAYRFGGAPRCSATQTVATAKLHPRGKPPAKGSKKCRVSSEPVVVPIGR